MIPRARGICAWPEVKRYARQVIDNARTLGEKLHKQGCQLVSGSTDNHLRPLDVVGKGISGRKAEQICDKVHITVNRNTILYDERPPFQGIGIRIGAPALTTRGMGPEEMRQVDCLIARALQSHEDEAAIAALRDEVSEVAASFPAPGSLTGRKGPPDRLLRPQAEWRLRFG